MSDKHLSRIAGKVSAARLKAGVARIRMRFDADDVPTMNALLNDIAGALAPKSNWGGLLNLWARAAAETQDPAKKEHINLPDPEENASRHPVVLRDWYEIPLFGPDSEGFGFRGVAAMKAAGLRAGWPQKPVIGLGAVLRRDRLSYTSGEVYQIDPWPRPIILEENGSVSIHDGDADVVSDRLAAEMMRFVQTLDGVHLGGLNFPEGVNEVIVLARSEHMIALLPCVGGRYRTPLLEFHGFDVRSPVCPVILHGGEDESADFQEELKDLCRLLSLAAPHLWDCGEKLLDVEPDKRGRAMRFEAVQLTAVS